MGAGAKGGSRVPTEASAPRRLQRPRTGTGGLTPGRAPHSGQPAAEVKGQHPATAMLPAGQSREKVLEEARRPIFRGKLRGGEGAPLTLPALPSPAHWASPAAGLLRRNLREVVVSPSAAWGQHHLLARRQRSAPLSWRRQAEAGLRRPLSLAAAHAAMLEEAVPSVRWKRRGFTGSVGERSLLPFLLARVSVLRGGGWRDGEK